jgi:hypothetical protein
MPLSLKQLTDVCLVYGGSARCRYLAEDELDGSKHYCLKMAQARRTEIDEEVKDFLAHCKKKGTDPTQHGLPIGDNCKGFPVLKHVEQGYDKN